ncbi:MAG: hypothetical protein KC636_14310 [Myxococcales bacterium]|nr:hypothetical protein [Myxococcales bacterium]
MSLATCLTVAASACDEPADEPADPADAHVLITDRDGGRVIRYDARTGARVDEMIGAGGTLDRPSSVLVRGEVVYLARFGDGVIDRYDLATGAPLGSLFRDTYWLEEPVELQALGDELLVLGNDSDNIVVLDAAGALVRQFGAPTMRAPHDFVVDARGRLLVTTEAAPGEGKVQVWDPIAGALLTSFGASLVRAVGITLGDDGDILVADEGGDRIARFDAERFTPRPDFARDDPRLLRPIDLELGPGPILYVVVAAGVLELDGVDGTPRGFLATVGDALTRPRSVDIAPPCEPTP